MLSLKSPYITRVPFFLPPLLAKIKMLSQLSAEGLIIKNEKNLVLCSCSIILIKPLVKNKIKRVRFIDQRQFFLRIS